MHTCAGSRGGQPEHRPTARPEGRQHARALHAIHLKYLRMQGPGWRRVGLRYYHSLSATSEGCIRLGWGVSDLMAAFGGRDVECALILYASAATQHVGVTSMWHFYTCACYKKRIGRLWGRSWRVVYMPSCVCPSGMWGANITPYHSRCRRGHYGAGHAWTEHSAAQHHAKISSLYDHARSTTRSFAAMLYSWLLSSVVL